MAVKPSPNPRRSLWIGGGAGVGVILIGIVWACWDPEPRVAPDPRNGKPNDILRFMASQTLAEMAPQQKYEYILKVANYNRDPETRKKILANVENLSDSKILQIRNNVADAVKIRFLNGTKEYQTIKDPAKKRKFIDQELTELDSFNGWVEDMKKIPKVQKVIPMWNQQGTFNILMERTNAVERATLETYMTDAFQRWVQRETRKRMSAGEAFLKKMQ
jgi:hypothetical protein